MAHSFLIFDFGNDEEAAQQASHRVEGWRQGFRLDKKLQVKFERKEAEEKQDTASEPAPKKAKADGKDAQAGIRLIVRLDFSDHEKLSHRQWLERIPSEEPFKAAKPKIVRSGDPEFAATAGRFDSLDHPSGAVSTKFK
jgi:hypothetical protein